MIVAEKDGSFTINCNEGEATMSTRSFGMVGKSYKTASEAFKDAEYATGIEMPQKTEYDHVWAILGGLTALGLVVWLVSRF
jgi:hypothetical protein